MKSDPRELARGTFRIMVRGVLVDDEHAVIFAGREVRRNGRRLKWETAAVFRIAAGQISER